MQIFLLEKINESSGRLNEEETRHCIQVLRHRKGDQIHAIDGKGNMYVAKIKDISRKEVWLTLLHTERDWGEKSPFIHLGISPLSKKDRFEWLLEKAVELGVNRISPVLCERSFKSRLPNEKRIQSIMVSALKQSKRSRLPELNDLQPLASLLLSDTSSIKLVAWCEAAQPLSTLFDTIKNNSSITLLIGPEGDFTPEEIQHAKHQQFIEVSLGNNRLRSETAGIYFLGAIKTICEY